MKKLLIISVLTTIFMTSCFLGPPSEEDRQRWAREKQEKERAEFVADSIRNEKLKPFDYKVSWKLKSLKFERQKELKIKAGFFLGCGSVSSKTEVHEEYYFYIETDRGVILKHLPVEKVYIIECDTIEPCATKVYHNVYFRYGVNKMFEQVKEGYYVSTCRTGELDRCFGNLESLDNMPIESMLYRSEHGRTYYNNPSANYIQLYVPVGTIIEKYTAYE